ncbi:MAG: 4-phosphoerythronate dehydrogenase [Muribaculum sp.]|nr:4-phosphoerythronate dehydrogenase [Muribaculaceae bacterium]MCM1080244.1 4-phosphoerythronate dehydrogenase [Muribaculum sp.]
MSGTSFEKVIVESKIPFIKGLLEPYFNVVYLAPDEITPQAIADADAMIIRTRTHCDQHLLSNSRCRFIATATIGTDHIDLDYCADNNITVANAPGCNAPAVAQYVLSTIGLWMQQNNRLPSQTTLGVVGLGHVGSIVAQWAQNNGINVLCCDPPLQLSGNSNRQFHPLETLAAQCDIITFHTPLTRQLPHPTFHLVNPAFINKLAKQPLIINSARGSIVDTDSLIQAYDNGNISALAIDCWENEPNINQQLLKRAFIATPHIAGYSIEGKKRATQMAINALTTNFAKPPVTLAEPAPKRHKQAPSLTHIIKSYNPTADTLQLKASPSFFETLRNNYNYRPEP